MRWFALAAVVLTSCMIPQAPAVVAPASQGQIEGQQREAFARSAGYPTRKTAADLDQMIAQYTKGFRPTGTRGERDLAAPAPIAITGVKGTCYVVVMRLAADATWDRGAEAGLRFDFQTPTGQGTGGPGLRGPGAVASVDCAEASGPITLTMAPLVGHDPIGHGALAYEVYSHVLTAKEARARAEDRARQEREAQDFAQQERAKKQARLDHGCSTCEARYQGCLGAGRDQSSCRSDYSSCAFEQAGPDWMDACPNP